MRTNLGLTMSGINLLVMPACRRIISQGLHRKLARIWLVSRGQESNNSVMNIYF